MACARTATRHASGCATPPSATARGGKESKKLLEFARKAKKEDEEDWKWRTQWRDVYYGYWNSGYPYYGVWNQTYWYY